ncbi:MAG: diguanylate cyclase [Polyangiaceae bacterium]|nr:diguanylate cyclase [Polyangiaceae bacterium]MBK9001507.1 diguanylate cyclase [Myxococcales bacterium]MCE7888530.1 diguanylate cyclase [Sorangiineae bacterium PRO1]MCL4753339.1 diguanylate cyclase [Myxococcales bacterium]
MPEFHRGEATFLRNCLGSFSEHFENSVVEVLSRELRGIQPANVQELREQIQLLMRQLESRAVHEAMEGLLKRVLLSERRRVAESLEVPLAKAVDPHVVGALHREVRRYEDLLAAPWCVAARAQRIPRLTDFLSIRFAAEAMPDAPALAPRAYDEKFHILEAPRLFFPDLAHFRHECELRSAELVVAYVDIDDFKAVNAKLTETVVDLKVLTPFLEIIEAWAFARAHAYRFGGDEYVLLVPNAGRSLAATLLGELRERIGAAVFSGTDVRLSVSMGACLVDPDCPLTDREVLGRANAAKARAKAERKGSIVIAEPPEYRAECAELG